MALGIGSTSQVSVTNAATQIVAVNSIRAAVVLNNTSSVTVYLGGASVTTANGHALPAGGSIVLAVESPIYGIVASGTAVVTAMEVQ